MVSELWHVWLYLSWALGAVWSPFLMLSLWRKAWGRTFAFWPVSPFEMTFYVDWLKSGRRPQPCMRSLVMENGPGTLVKAERCTAFQVYSSHLSQLNVTESPVLLDTRPVCLRDCRTFITGVDFLHLFQETLSLVCCSFSSHPWPASSLSFYWYFPAFLLHIPSVVQYFYACVSTTFWFSHFSHYLLNISELISF